MLRYRHLRWIIVALLFASTVLNYADRQTLSVLAPTLRREFHLSDQDYARAVSAFLFTYTIMYAFAGRLSTASVYAWDAACALPGGRSPLC